jgi:hypothetical protein
MKNTAYLLMFLISQSAYADDWGCQVMLCMSNPAGPMAVAECVPPMQRLYDAMSRKGFQWPTCDLAGKPDSPKPFTVDPVARPFTSTDAASASNVGGN